MNVSLKLHRILLGLAGLGLFYLLIICLPYVRGVWSFPTHFIVSLPFALLSARSFSRLPTSNKLTMIELASLALLGFIGGYVLILGAMFASLPYGIDGSYLSRDEADQMMPYFCSSGIISILVSVVVSNRINNKISKTQMVEEAN